MQPHTITYLTHCFSSFKVLAPNPYRYCPACRSWRTSVTTWTTRSLSSRRLNSNWPDSRELQTSMKTMLLIIDNCRTWPVLKSCWSLRERLTMFKSESGYLIHAREKSLTLQHNKCKCKHSSYVKERHFSSQYKNVIIIRYTDIVPIRGFTLVRVSGCSHIFVYSLCYYCICAHCVFASRYRQLKQQYELIVEEEQILQAKLQQSSFHQQQEELERLRKAIGQNANRTQFWS